MPELLIERLGGLGDGLANWQNRLAVVPKTLPGERVEANLTPRRAKECVGTVERLLTTSPERIPAPCPHFERCGGCALQHLQRNAYEDFKRRTLKEALRKTGQPDAEGDVTFLPSATRRRVEFRLRNGMHFHAPHSHALVPIHTCPVLTPELQSLLPALNKALADVPNGSLQLTHGEDGIDAVLHGAPSTTLQNIGIARINGEGKPLHVRLGQRLVPLPPGAFLQASREGQEAITSAVAQGIGDATRVLDLFAGIGTYSHALPAVTHAAEGDPAMANALKISGLHAVQRDLFTRPYAPKELHTFDAVILNPPRAGALAQCGQLATSRVPKVVMVSCNPATFARDARVLLGGGYRLTRAQGIDQFVWSAHLEIVATFDKPR